MRLTAAELAEHACFETFVNCYVRELESGAWHSRQDWASRSDQGWAGEGALVLALALPQQRATLAFDVVYRSVAGRHRLQGPRLRQGHSEWQDIREYGALLLLVRELSLARSDSSSAAARAQELELVGRLTQSLQITARYVAARQDDLRLAGDRFVDSEQSMLYGHWSHPTPKSRQGMADWQHESYAPELRGEFQLRYFAVQRCLVEQHSALHASAEELIAGELTRSNAPPSSLPGKLAPSEVLLPVHPLQADWLSHQDHVRRLVASGALREIGPLGPRYTATSSVRTVYSPGSPWMLKLSIPVKITNSLRFNQQHEMLAGVAMAAVTEELEIATRYPGFRVIADPACITVLSPGRRESGFEVILRTNPFMAGRDTGVHCLAAIVQEPMPHRASRLRALIEGLALAEGRSVQDVCLEWFARYFECAVAPLIRLYDEHGIALEAHQQNSLLDLSAGYPQRYFYRDNQGYYISRAERTTLMERVPELRRLPELFYEDALIRERLSYYLVVNQLFSVVHRFGSDGLLAEERLLSFIAGRLMESSRVLGARGREFVRGLLEERRLAYKANLLTRLHDLDELTAPLQRPLYTTIDNPLCLPGAHVSEARDVA